MRYKSDEFEKNVRKIRDRNREITERMVNTIPRAPWDMINRIKESERQPDPMERESVDQKLRRAVKRGRRKRAEQMIRSAIKTPEA